MFKKIIYYPMLLVKDWKYKHKDKVMHFIIGIVIVLLASLFVEPITSLLIGLSAGFTKEALDKYVINGTVDVYDAIATWAGSIVGFILIVG